MLRKQSKKQKIGILRNPTTVKSLAKEIITASDHYTAKMAKMMDEQEYRELIIYFATHHGKKLFSVNGSINPTIKNRIGSKRCSLVELMLAGFQISIIQRCLKRTIKHIKGQIVLLFLYF